MLMLFTYMLGENHELNVFVCMLLPRFVQYRSFLLQGIICSLPSELFRTVDR